MKTEIPICRTIFGFSSKISFLAGQMGIQRKKKMKKKNHTKKQKEGNEKEKQKECKNK